MNKTFNTRKNHNYSYAISNENIFDIISQRVKGAHEGSTVLVPHVCNNIDLFGAGFAAQIAQFFPSVKTDYHLLGKKFLQTNMGYAQMLKVYEEPKYKHKLYIVNMIAQNGVVGPKNVRPINYYGLVKSMASVARFIDSSTGFLQKSENVEIHCPKFGSGLAGGNWSFISDLIEDIWGKYPVFVYSHKHEKNK